MYIICTIIHKLSFQFIEKELVKGFGVYAKFVHVEQCEQNCKTSATGLIRSLISIWYSRRGLLHVQQKRNQ